MYQGGTQYSNTDLADGSSTTDMLFKDDEKIVDEVHAVISYCKTSKNWYISDQNS